MHRLRHPIRSITEPFGKAGLTVAILALVLATTGAAFAAVGLNSKQKKEVTKIAKKYAGKPGAPGANGTNGTNGSPGAAGKEGPEGKAGANGTPAEATSFTGSKTVGSVTCTEGGIAVKSAKPETAVCNGKEGEPGTTGFTEFLPSEATETGTWVAPPSPTTSEFAALSFPIPLQAALGLSATHYVTRGEQELHSQPTACAGGTFLEPVAQPGNLCVYEGGGSQGVIEEEEGEELVFITKSGASGANGGAGKAGSSLAIISTAAGARFMGSFAVTAP